MIDIKIKFKPLGSDHSFLFDLLFAGALIWFLFGWTFCFNGWQTDDKDTKETSIFVFLIFFVAPSVIMLILGIMSLHPPVQSI